MIEVFTEEKIKEGYDSKYDLFTTRMPINYAEKKKIIAWTTALGHKRPIFDYIEDKENQIAEDFTEVPITHCRKCKRTIIPYTQEFAGIEFDGTRTRLIFGMAGGYCRVCAYKEAKRHNRVVPGVNTDTYVIYNTKDGSRLEYVDPITNIPTGDYMEDSDDFKPLKVCNGRFD